MTKPMMILLAGVACATLAGAVAAQPPAAADVNGRAILFDAPNFQGHSITIEQGSGDLRRQAFDQRARSGHFEGDWLVCKSAAYTGRCVVVTGDVENFSEVGLSGRLSSLRLQSESDEAQRPADYNHQADGAAPDEGRQSYSANDRAPAYSPPAYAAPTYPTPPAPAYSAPAYAAPTYQDRAPQAATPMPAPPPPAYAVPTPAPTPYASAPVPDEGVRGHSVTFFAHPRMNGGDVAAYDRAAADAFCRQQGLGESVYYDTSERMLRAQEWNGAWESNAPVLRDVLCRRH